MSENCYSIKEKKGDRGNLAGGKRSRIKEIEARILSVFYGREALAGLSIKEKENLPKVL